MGNYSSKDSKANLTDKKDQNFKSKTANPKQNYRNNKFQDKNNNSIREEVHQISREKRKHFLNRLTYIKKKETFVEENSIQKHSIGNFSYFDDNLNSNLFEIDYGKLSNNIKKIKFSNSFVEDYNPNNYYINKYFNSHNIIDPLVYDYSINLSNSRRKENEEAKKRTEINKYVIEDDSDLICISNTNQADLNFENIDFHNGKNNKGNNLNRNKNLYVSNKITIQSNDSRNHDTKVSFCTNFTREETKSKNSRLSGYLNRIIDYNGGNDNYFNNIKNFRKSRKTVISNLINDSISYKNKNFEKAYKSSESYSYQKDFLCNQIINNSQILITPIKNEKNKHFPENCYNSLDKNIKNKTKILLEKRQSSENNCYIENEFPETRNSLFLDLKNKNDFFFENQSSNNLANNSFSDIGSTSDTKIFEISKPRSKTPYKEIDKLVDCSLSIRSPSNKSEPKTIDILSKSYVIFDFNKKKQEENLSSEFSSLSLSEKDSSINKSIQKSMSFEYEKVEKHNSTNKSSLDANLNSNNISELYKGINEDSDNKENFTTNIEKKKAYSNKDIVNINANKDVVKNKDLPANNKKNISSNEINCLYYENSTSYGNYSQKFRESILSNIYALNKSSNNIYNNLNKNPLKNENNKISNSFYLSNHNINKNNSDNSFLFSDANSTFLISASNKNLSTIDYLNSEKAKNEYELNYIRVKHSENLRKNYIAKLIYKKIWQPSKKEKNHNSLIIFDWDDTLLCTSFLTPNGIYREDLKLSDKDLEKLAKLEFSVLRLLTLAVEKGDVYIVTNAAPGWVEFSAEKYYPSLSNIIKKINIISARGEYEKDFPGDSRIWKIQSFLNMQKNFDSNLITNIICLGDSFIEMEAAQILAGKFSKAFIKSVKFRESPKPEELTKQLTLVGDQFLSIYSAIKNLTIRVERKLKK